MSEIPTPRTDHYADFGENYPRQKVVPVDVSRKLERELVFAAKKADDEMLLVKACEHIAEGMEGWEVLRNECPSAAAVASLRDGYAELQRLFDLQHSRVGEATELWQKATGKEGVLPDLGELVKWLLDKIAKQDSIIGRVSRMCEIAEKCNDAHTETEAALSCSFAEAMAYQMVEEKEREIAELQQWKREMLQVESQWDEQAVGREIEGLVLGQSIRAAILAYILKLKGKSS